MSDLDDNVFKLGIAVYPSRYSTSFDFSTEMKSEYQEIGVHSWNRGLKDMIAMLTTQYVVFPHPFIGSDPCKECQRAFELRKQAMFANDDII